MKRVIWADTSPGDRLSWLKRPAADASIAGKVAVMLDRIECEGEAEIRRLASRFDNYAPADFRVDEANLRDSFKRQSADVIDAIRSAADAVRRFHVQQGYRAYEVETWPGVTAGRRALPLETVGLYVPAGSAPLVSTLIMLAIPAQLAGVERIVVCAPPSGENGIAPALLAAAECLGLTEVYALGGVQAVAAMAQGLCGLPKVDKIFGPGNAYVAAAKSLLASRPDGCAMDLPAGPSEVLVIADETADPDFVASDLLSQAEHDPMAQVVLVLTGELSPDLIEAALARQLEAMSRRSIAMEALESALCIQAGSVDEAVDIANAYAPEHLIIQTCNPDGMLAGIRHAGSVFVGPWAPEAAGDYAAGPNHTLPTGGTARAYGGVGVESFQKTMTVLRATPQGAAVIAPVVETLANVEGLDAHVAAMSCRRQKAGQIKEAPAAPRAASVRRRTNETDIVCTLQLDRPGSSRIRTGIGFFDHMLDQVARHGDFHLEIDADGDLEIDAHHTIEDVCLVFGDTLRQALGDKKGIGRFGFELPMDESRAAVWIDLSGRPFCRFDGVIPDGDAGGFPADMTEHAFRSIAESLGAAVHVTVSGNNRHHMIEACFKAFGRALRQAKTLVDDQLPSTKGVLS